MGSRDKCLKSGKDSNSGKLWPILGVTRIILLRLHACEQDL
jgi:hypothetical protein